MRCIALVLLLKSLGFLGGAAVSTLDLLPPLGGARTRT